MNHSRVSLIRAVAALAFTASTLLAQSQPPATTGQPATSQANQPAQGQSAQKPGGNPPAPGQNAPAAAQGAPSTPAPPHSKAQPQAQTQEEFNAYQAVVTKPDPATMETAAADFAAKYPSSELLVAMYSAIMQKYQNINNADKTLAMGRKILQLDAENIPALALSSYVLSESTRETDLDRDQKYAEAMKDAQQVIKTIDTALVVPPSVTPEQLAGVKGFLISMAESAMGYVEMNQKNYAASEQHFKAALEANKTPQADPMTYLRLAIAQDNQKKYADAMASVDKAIQVAQTENAEQVVSMAKNEKDRLTKLGGSGTAKAPTPKQ